MPRAFSANKSSSGREPHRSIHDYPKHYSSPCELTASTSTDVTVGNMTRKQRTPPKHFCDAVMNTVPGRQNFATLIINSSRYCHKVRHRTDHVLNIPYLRAHTNN